MATHCAMLNGVIYRGTGFHDWTGLSDLFGGWVKAFLYPFYLLIEVQFELKSILEFIDGFTSRLFKDVERWPIASQLTAYIIPVCIHYR